MKNNSLYIFIDESGNFDFSHKGTRHFILTSITTKHPFYSRDKFINLKYELLNKGNDQEFFHATEDRQFVRDRVFNLIKNLDDMEIDIVAVKKGLFDNKFLTDEEFYKIISKKLLDNIYYRYDIDKNLDSIIVVLGKIFTRQKHESILKNLKNYLKRRFRRRFYIYFHRSEADINCQIVDYCSWAGFVYVERGEERPLKEINGQIKNFLFLD
ncbi:MAG: DUF3800 domain-containing protein [Patescibacteria group bacterium]|nr:MAG: DUF3800 domain-containing protein [Patescibacteria group bacterium]